MDVKCDECENTMFYVVAINTPGHEREETVCTNCGHVIRRSAPVQRKGMIEEFLA